MLSPNTATLGRYTVSRCNCIFCPSIVVRSSILFALYSILFYSILFYSILFYSILFAYFNSMHAYFPPRPDDNNNNTDLQSKRKRVNDGDIQGILIICITR